MTLARRATRPATHEAAGPPTAAVGVPPPPARSTSAPADGPAAARPVRDEPPAPAEPPDLVPLRAPRDGVTPLIDTPQALTRYAAALAAGSGPVAVDAERASSYRYGQRAYLVQLRRAGAGTGLIDPIALGGDLSEIDAALGGVEWVLHAADQDLPCLREAGMTPDALFDTELAARLLGRSRVGLAAVVADDLGLELAKEHSASDWSVRPLPEDWLVYAALDVELLVPLRELLGEQLVEAGKDRWAAQEFEHVRTAPPKPAPREPWRKLPRLTGTVRTPRGLAVARALWEARDDLARRRDRSPTRVLPSASLVAAAAAMPRTAAQLAALPEFSGKGTRPHVPYWFEAIESALALPEEELPARRAPREEGEPPQPRSWRTLKPLATDRLDAVHEVVRPLASRLRVPQENLLQPAAQKALAWQGAGRGRVDAEEVADRLTALRARPWQVELVAAPLARALNAVEDRGPRPPEAVSAARGPRPRSR